MMLAIPAALAALSLAVSAQDAPIAISSEAAAALPAAALPPAVEPKKAKFKTPEAAAEWRFLKDAAADADLADALPQTLQVFVRQHLDDPAAVDAKFLEAQLREKYGDHQTALVDYLRVMHENPSSPLALQAKSAFLALADKKLGRKYKPALGDLVSVLDSSDKAARLARMLDKVSSSLADAVYEPALIEFARFQIRYPDYEGMDGVDWNLGWLHERNDKHSAALLQFKKIAAVYPDSELRPQALAAIGKVYAEDLREYPKAVAAYQDLVAQYPDHPAALDALQATAKLFVEKLKQYDLAVEIDEKIARKYPKTPTALQALRGEADLLRGRLARPADAIGALKRVPDNAAPVDAVDALEDAAQIARKDLKDYRLEVALRRRVASDFATIKDAADQLYQAGEVAEADLKDAPQAASIYQEVQAKFAGTKAAKRAADRIAKLEKK